MKDLAVLALLLLAIIGSSLVVFLGGKAVAWFFRKKNVTKSKSRFSC